MLGFIFQHHGAPGDVENSTLQLCNWDLHLPSLLDPMSSSKAPKNCDCFGFWVVNIPILGYCGKCWVNLPESMACKMIWVLWLWQWLGFGGLWGHASAPRLTKCSGGFGLKIWLERLFLEEKNYRQRSGDELTRNRNNSRAFDIYEISLISWYFMDRKFSMELGKLQSSKFPLLKSSTASPHGKSSCPIFWGENSRIPSSALQIPSSDGWIM